MEIHSTVVDIPRSMALAWLKIICMRIVHKHLLQFFCLFLTPTGKILEDLDK